MQRRILAVAALLGALSSATAQQTDRVRFELRPVASLYLPFGSQGDDFKSAPSYGLQAGLELSTNFHVLASGSWMDGRSKIPALVDGNVTMWQYDLGIEANSLHRLASAWLFRPFVGAGAGERTYDYRQPGVAMSTCTAGYAAAGTEFQRSVLAFRLESRGYISCFKQPLTGESLNRSDVLFSFGLAYHVN